MNANGRLLASAATLEERGKALGFTAENIQALRERRAFTTPHLIAAHTKGGTYVIASSGKWNDSGLPRDLLAVLPGDLGHGHVLELWITVSDTLRDFVAEVTA